MPRQIIGILVFLFAIGTLLTRNSLCQTLPLVQTLHDHWQITSSKRLDVTDPSILSTTLYDASSWYPATIPSTVLSVLEQQGIFPNILNGMTLQTIPNDLFDVPWWYRTTFQVNVLPKNAQLDINGINYRADVWLNGKKIASADTIYCPFRQYQLDITSYLQKGSNVIAFQVYPPQADDFRIGFTDWNPNPPDHSMGIFRDIKLHFNDGIELKDLAVQTELNSPANDEAKIRLQLTVINHLSQSTTALIKLQLGNEATKFTQKLHLRANEQRLIQITEADNRQFLVHNPRLWWPNKMGDPNLYTLTASINQNGVLSDTQTLHFGIRKIESFIQAFHNAGTPPNSYYRGFKINGVPLLIRGAAWTDSMLLNDTPDRVQTQLKYAKAMNLNTIRLEGFWGNDTTLYDTCDRLGLLIMIGWSAQWEWPLQGFRSKEQCSKVYGCYTTNKDQALILASFEDQMRWLRNHPSVGIWMLGSDMKPFPELEEKLSKNLHSLNPNDVYILSAAEQTSDVDKQPSGMKMRGPYIYVPPVYWFQNTTEGGAFGFNTETGPGAEIPPLESLEKMLESSSDFWPNTSPAWTFHLGNHPALQTLDRYDEAMKARYGKANNLKEYAQKAQLMNYESIRPMFEAFAAYRQGNPYLNGTPATGVIHWMLNAAWPKFFWQLFDYYLVPGSAYFSAKEANKAIHVLYNYADHALYLNNDTRIDQDKLQVIARLWDSHSTLLSTQQWTCALPANQAIKLDPITVPNTLNTNVYFLDLRLNDSSGRELDKNVYWLSKQADKLDSGTTILQQANYQELNQLPTAMLHVNYAIETVTNAHYKLTATIENTSDHIAFFNRFIVTSPTHPTGITPIDWNDNFITLFPHETRVITAEFLQNSADSDALNLTIKAFNSEADIFRQ